jgi:hypothetical protein
VGQPGESGHLRLYLLPALDRIPLRGLGIHDVQAMFEQIISDHFRAGHPIAPERWPEYEPPCWRD